MRRSVHTPTKKELMQGILWMAFVLFLLFGAAFLCSINGQNVVRKGKTFYQQSNSSKIEKDSAVFSGYHYFDTKGVRYPIYISSKGKYFIFRTSAKTGKRYKQYLPEVTRQLNSK